MMKKAAGNRAPYPVQQTARNKGIGKHQSTIPGFVADSPPLNLLYELFRLGVLIKGNNGLAFKRFYNLQQMK